jgi:hypothetical protein
MPADRQDGKHTHESPDSGNDTFGVTDRAQFDTDRAEPFALLVSGHWRAETWLRVQRLELNEILY